MKKQCFTCKKRPRHITKGGVRRSYCIECLSKYIRKTLIEKYGTTNFRKIPKYAENRREQDKEYQKEKRARLVGYKAKEYENYRKRYPERVYAHRVLNQAKKNGLIKQKRCEDCGNKKLSSRVVAHHSDYTKPLKVKWLCEIHHKNYHKVVQ